LVIKNKQCYQDSNNKNNNNDDDDDQSCYGINNYLLYTYQLYSYCYVKVGVNFTILNQLQYFIDSDCGWW